MKKVTEKTNTVKTLEKSQNVMEQTNNNDSNSNNELIKMHEVENTPFTLIETEEGIHVMLGKYRLTAEPFTDANSAYQDAKRTDWERMMQVMGVMIEEFKK